MNIRNLKLTPLSSSMKKPSVAEWKTIEEQLGSTLPSDYKQFITRYRGGAPEISWFRAIKKSAFPESVACICHFDKYLAAPNSMADWCSVSAALYKISEEYPGIIPKGWLVIATDELDNVIVLKIKGSNTGKVGYIIVPQGFEDDVDKIKVYPLSATFSDFLLMLRETEDEVE